MKDKAPRRRCDARNRRGPAAQARALEAGGVPRLRKLMRSSRCRNWALAGSKRCRLHGGHSTGPRTPEGMSRTVEALKAGRARWLAKLRAEGRPIPYGRKKGGHNRSIEERAQVAWERQCLREWRDASRQNRSERKARRDREAAARFNAGGPFWTDDAFRKVYNPDNMNYAPWDTHT
jgi:hypothetical protein